MKENIIMLSDSYKYSHTEQYPSNTVSLFDYAEARSDKVYPETVFVGLQYYLKNFLSKRIKMKDVKEARDYAEAHGIPFNYKGWKYIAKNLYGKLPIRIKAIPEGTLVPVKNPLFTVESTDPKVYWVASWAETLLLKVWYTSNIATKSFYIKRKLLEFANETSDVQNVDFQFLNFSDRGCSSVESAALSGIAHLTQFLGTDNFNSLRYMMNTYDTSIDTIGYSIKASEHSSCTSWGKDKEFDMIMNHYKLGKGDMVVAAVLDSYDYYKAVSIICNKHSDFQELINSDKYPVFVMRPDSGDPVEVIRRTFEIMIKEDVPSTTNSKGFKVFNKMKVLFGDGIKEQDIINMCNVAKDMKISTENLVFGMGGGLVNDIRDTQGWAIKCSSITLSDGTERDVFKDPVTAPNKKSKKGRITTYYNRTTKEYFTDTIDKDFDSSVIDALELVYENGEILRRYSLEDIRQNSVNCL